MNRPSRVSYNNACIQIQSESNYVSTERANLQLCSVDASDYFSVLLNCDLVVNFIYCCCWQWLLIKWNFYDNKVELCSGSLSIQSHGFLRGENHLKKSHTFLSKKSKKSKRNSKNSQKIVSKSQFRTLFRELIFLSVSYTGGFGALSDFLSLPSSHG